MWKLLAIVVHILLIGFISIVYFEKTIINGLRPQKVHRELGLEPPADRLVVFIIDGLRAQSFFRNNCTESCRLQKMILEQGVAGVSLGSAPTQRRPGHIAIFGGFNEDASAALTNFKWNPTVFDTVLNRTKGGTWAWGAKSILNFFKCLPTDGAPLNLNMHTNSDFRENYQRHQWISDKVRNFLATQESLKLVKEKRPSLFYMDFEDIDRIRPNSEDFLAALNNTEYVISELYELFENTFKDKRTAYLLTSDHGMTEKGTHGGDSLLEIEMPFVIWGAGVLRTGERLSSKSNSQLLKLHRLEQTQLAPLMSALIGLPPPMNNLAMLPVGVMDVSLKYEAHSMHLNALQMLAQVERVLLQRSSHIRDWLPKYERLDERRIRNYHQQIFRQMQLGCAKQAIQSSQNMIELANDFLEYHRIYYRIPLMVACIASYLGWFFYLVAKQARPLKAPKQDWISIQTILLLLLEIGVALVCYLHRVPCCTSFYLMVPLPIWIVALRERGLHSRWMQAPLINLAWIGASIVLIISTFYIKQLISLGFLIVVCANNGHAFTRAPRLKFWLWLALVALLAGFALQRPNMGHNSPYLLYLSMLVTLLRPLLLSEGHAWRVWLSNGGALLLSAYCVSRSLMMKDVSQLVHGTAWCYVGYALISIPYSNTKTPKQRVQLIHFNLSTIYTMLCRSYESIFLQLLCLEFQLGVLVNEDYKQSSDVDSEDDENKPDKSLTPVGYINTCYRYALLILIYAYFSMIGTEQLPNINSIESNVARVFMSECCPFVIGSLIILKLLIPIIIIMSCMYAYCAHARQNLSGIFICLFLICDVICLYFFFFVRNSGSWHNVRDSLSQQLIVHGLPMLLALFSWLPKQLLSAFPMTMLPMLRWNRALHFPEPGQSQA